MERLEVLFGGDDRAVSPVIGVILMVAITVILAAIIGTFVLGLGGDLDAQPNAQIDITSDGDDTITIEHNGGDTVGPQNVDIVLRNGSSTVDRETLGDVATDVDGDITVGDSVTVELNTADGDNTVDNVRLIHTPSDSILADRTVDETDEVVEDDAFANGA